MRRLRFSIRARIIALSIGFSALIALGVCVASLTAAQRSAARAQAQSIEYSLQIAAGNIAQNVAEIDALADWCTVDSTIRGYIFSSSRSSHLLNAYNTLLAKYSSQHTARYIQRLLITDGSALLMQQGVTVSQSYVLTADTLDELPGFQSGAEEDSWAQLGEDRLFSFGARQVIPVIQTIRNFSTGQRARVYISVSPSLITDTLHSYVLPEGSALYWVMGGEVYGIEDGALRPTGCDYEGVFAPAPAGSYPELLDERTAVYADGERSVMVYPVGTEHGLYLAQLLPDSSGLWARLPIALPLGLALVCILLLGAVLGILLRRLIVAPVRALQSQLSAVGAGDFTPNPAIEWDNEMGDIGRGINGLTRSVSSLMERRLEDERQKKDLEYRMLQNQINPHFIYNTLNSIRWMATIQNAPGIAEVVMALSRLLKSVSKGNERLVPLQEEFALLNDYFTIQQYRYGGTVTMDVSYIEDERLCQSCRIPRFTLQPLVENSIFHGIEPKGCAGSISLVVRRDAATGDVLIDLCDDGVGMSAEQAARALREPGPEEAAAKYRHVGMWNVHRRLQYSFGEGYGLSIRSEPGRGTTVTVRLPEAGGG